MNEVVIVGQEDLEKISIKLKEKETLSTEMGAARFKIELMLGTSRSMHRPTLGMMQFWESGSKLDGEGDAKIYLCPGKHRGVNNCQSPIPDNACGYDRLVCPKCGTMWRGEQVIGEVGARLPLEKWAILVHKYYLILGLNSDIVLRYAPDDIRSAIAKEKIQCTGEHYRKERESTQHAIYPLANIVRDTSGGAELIGRIEAFLKA